MKVWKIIESLTLGRQLRSSSPTIWKSGVMEGCNRERMEGWKGIHVHLHPNQTKTAYTPCLTALSSHISCPSIHTSQTLLDLYKYTILYKMYNCPTPSIDGNVISIGH